MRGFTQFFVTAAIYAEAKQVDCTGFKPWSAKVSGNPDPKVGFKVHYKNVGYTSYTWVSQSDVPGTSGAWTEAGECQPGTASDKEDDNNDKLTVTIDCTGFRPWSAKVSGNPDPKEGFKAHYKGNGYIAKTYVAGDDVPGDKEFGPWVLQGACKPGTASDKDDNNDKPSVIVDCTGYRPWSAKVVGNPDPHVGYKAHYKGVGYVTKTYVDAHDVPGEKEFGPWVAQGTCKPGTASDKDNGGSDLPEIDCSKYMPWTKEQPIQGNPPSWNVPLKAYTATDSIAYEARIYVDKKDVPGTPDASGNSPWTAVGKCKAGTMGDGLEEVDCSKIHSWTPYVSFQGKETVHDKDYSKDGITRVWNIKWWTEGDIPELGEASPYVLLGKCKKGTDNLGPEKDVVPPPQWKLDLTCFCCEECGTIKDGQVKCTKGPKEKCWYKWCEGSNKMDAAKCKEAQDQGKFTYWDGTLPEAPKSWPAQVYAPYFDAGLARYPPLTDIMDKYGIKHFIMAFMVSTTLQGLKTGKCQGAFAGAIPLEAGPQSYFDGGNHYLYDELKKVREKGGDFVVSFGGANGTELADSAECQQGDPVANLVAEYGRVLDFLKTDRIDFDIEGAAYAKIQADKGWTYRFNAVKELKKKRPNLHVTWTLPILPTGLTPDDGVAFINKMFELDAPFNLINVMNMDYGDCNDICHNEEIDKCERNAIDNLVKQLFDSATQYKRAEALGWKSPADVYPFVGTTPMLGKNDITCLTYTLEAAKTNLKYWQEKKIALISNWSLHRDLPCPNKTYVDVGCSSYPGQTEPYQFAEIFSAFGKN